MVEINHAILCHRLQKEKVSKVLGKANEMRWYRHVLRRDDGHVLRKALEF